MGGISIGQLLIIAIIIILLCGTDKLRNLGSDLGSCIRDFKKAMNDDEHNNQLKEEDMNSNSKNILNKQQTSVEKEDISNQR